MYLHACTVQFVCTHMDVCITMYIYILYMQVLNECLTVTKFVSCRLTSVYMYLHACTVQFVCTHMDVCMYNVHIHSLHAGAQWVSRSDRVCVLQVDVCICIYMHVLYAHTWTYACTMYIYILYMQVLKGCLAVCVLQVDVYTCIYMHVLCSLHAHTWTYACTMYIYILYMQVLNGCLAVTEFASCRLTSVYLCAHTWTYNVHIHSLHAGVQ